MHKYLNLGGNSSVTFFETGTDFIKVWFNNSPFCYLYNYIKPGKVYVEHMKELANQGYGLCSYIGRNVKKNYFRKGE